MSRYQVRKRPNKRSHAPTSSTSPQLKGQANSQETPPLSNATSSASSFSNLAAEFAKAMRTSPPPIPTLPTLGRNSSSASFSAWETSLQTLRITTTLNETEILQAIRGSFDNTLVDALICLHGSDAFYSATSSALVSMLHQFLVPRKQFLAQAMEVSQCVQRRGESVRDYFFHKCSLINAAFPEAPVETKIAFIQEGLLPFIKHRALSLCRMEDTITMCRYLHILEEVESYTGDTGYKQFALNNNRYRDGNHNDHPHSANRSNVTLAQESQFNVVKISQESPALMNFGRNRGYVSHTSGRSGSKADICLQKTNYTHTDNTHGYLTGEKKRSFQTPTRRKTQTLLEVKLNILKHSLTAIIDTGAEISVVRQDVAESLGLSRNAVSLNLWASNGTRCDVNGFVQMQFKFFGITASADFVVMRDSSHDVILGIDFLTKYRISVDAANSCLWHEEANGERICWDLSRVEPSSFTSAKGTTSGRTYVIPQELLQNNKQEEKHWQYRAKVNSIHGTSDYETQSSYPDGDFHSKECSKQKCAFICRGTTYLPPNSLTWLPVACTETSTSVVLVLPSISLISKCAIRIPSGMVKTSCQALLVTNTSKQVQVIQKGVHVANGFEPFRVQRVEDLCAQCTLMSKSSPSKNVEKEISNPEHSHIAGVRDVRLSKTDPRQEEHVQQTHIKCNGSNFEQTLLPSRFLTTSVAEKLKTQGLTTNDVNLLEKGSLLQLKLLHAPDIQRTIIQKNVLTKGNVKNHNSPNQDSIKETATKPNPRYISSRSRLQAFQGRPRVLFFVWLCLMILISMLLTTTLFAEKDFRKRDLPHLSLKIPHVTTPRQFPRTHLVCRVDQILAFFEAHSRNNRTHLQTATEQIRCGIDKPQVETFTLLLDVKELHIKEYFVNFKTLLYCAPND